MMPGQLSGSSVSTVVLNVHWEKYLASIDCLESEKLGWLALSHFGQSNHKMTRAPLGIHFDHDDSQCEADSVTRPEIVFFLASLADWSLRRYAVGKQWDIGMLS
jgi:hypothetical protein